jgi:hypothetical protein
MNNKEKALIKAKKIEFWIGFFFLIPAIFGVIGFMLNLLVIDGGLAEMCDLSSRVTSRIDYSYDDSGGEMSTIPIYLGLMAMVGAYLIKDSVIYLFIKADSDTPTTVEEESNN